MNLMLTKQCTAGKSRNSLEASKKIISFKKKKQSNMRTWQWDNFESMSINSFQGCRMCFNPFFTPLSPVGIQREMLYRS